MNYLNSKFSVYAPDSDKYRRNWDRIFGSSKLDAAILARAVKLNAERSQVVFRPGAFADLARSDAEILSSLQRLAVLRHFVVEYKLSCADGHVARVDSSYPTENVRCHVCDALLDLNDEFTYDLNTYFLYAPR